MLKKLGLLVLLLGTGGFALGYFYWKQATGVPQWYAAQQIANPVPNNTTISASPEELQAQKAEVLEKIDRQIAAQPSQNSQQETIVRLEPQDLDRLIVTSIAQKPQGQKLLAATQGIQTKIEQDKLEVGAVVDLQKLNTEVLTGANKAAFEKVVQNFPIPLDREVYVGLEGTPRIENGKLKVDENTKVKIGALSLSAMDIAKQLGVPPDALVAEINKNLDQIDVKELYLAEDSLLLKGVTKEAIDRNRSGE